VGKISFLYLDLPIRDDPRRQLLREPVVAWLKNRLSGWKSRFFFYGDRLVLLKSVLTSLFVYALSFFKVPLGIISSIESLLINFFLGGILGKSLGLTGNLFAFERSMEVWG
jgi:hypothetical protein